MMLFMPSLLVRKLTNEMFLYANGTEDLAEANALSLLKEQVDLLDSNDLGARLSLRFSGPRARRPPIPDTRVTLMYSSGALLDEFILEEMKHEYVCLIILFD